MRQFLVVVVTLFFITAKITTSAQDNSPITLPPLKPITTTNASQITEVARIGNGITSNIQNILLSPDGSTLAIGNSLGVWLYNAHDWNEHPRFLQIGEGDVSDIVFSPNSQSIAILNYPFWYGVGQSFTVWDVQTGVKKFALKTNTVNGNITYSPNGKLLASGDMGDLKLFNGENGDLLATIQATTAVVAKVAFSPNSQLIAATNGSWKGPGTMITEQENIIRIWNVDNALNKTKLTIDDAVLTTETLDFPYQIRFSPDSRTLAFNFSKYSTSFWNLDSNTTQTFDNTSDHFGPVDSHFVFQQNQQLVTYDPQTNQSQAEMQLAEQAQFGDSANGSTAYWITNGDTLHLWDGHKEQNIKLDKASDIASYVLRGDLLIALQPDGIRIWNAKTGLSETYLEGFIPSSPSIQFALSLNGKLLAYSLNGSNIHLLDLEKSQILYALNGDLALSFSPDAQYLTFQRDNNTILWDVKKNSEAKVFPFKGRFIFSSDSSVFAFIASYPSSASPIIDIYKTASLTKIFSIPHGAADLSFNGDGSRLTTISDKIVTLWNVTEGKIITQLSDPFLSFNTGLSFGPNGRPVAALAQNAVNPPNDEQYLALYQVPTSIEVYDVRSRRRRHYFEFQPISQNLGGNVYPSVQEWTVKFSPQGNWLAFIATAELETTGVFLWDLQRNEMHTLAKYNIDTYTNPTFSPDGTLLMVTGGNYLVMGGANLDSSVYIYDVKTQTRLGVLANHTEAPSQVEMSQDNKLIVSASNDGTIRLWGVPK